MIWYILGDDSCYKLKLTNIYFSRKSMKIIKRLNFSIRIKCQGKQKNCEYKKII